jgi:hypothetical protein
MIVIHDHHYIFDGLSSEDKEIARQRFPVSRDSLPHD